jgi:hypothetical protein
MVFLFQISLTRSRDGEACKASEHPQSSAGFFYVPSKLKERFSIVVPPPKIK